MPKNVQNSKDILNNKTVKTNIMLKIPKNRSGKSREELRISWYSTSLYKFNGKKDPLSCKF